MPTLHWASDTSDETETACGQPVGYVLVELEEDVTSEPNEQFDRERQACKDCKEELAKSAGHSF